MMWFIALLVVSLINDAVPPAYVMLKYNINIYSILQSHTTLYSLRLY